jgi:hypothetical protein
MTPEDEARKDIDELLKKAGWVLQDYKQLGLGAGLGVAVRSFPLTTGFADYMLFIDRKAQWNKSNLIDKIVFIADKGRTWNQYLQVSIISISEEDFNTISNAL